MNWDNFLKRSIVDDRWRSSSFAQAFGVLCATSFATVIVALSPSVQADNSVLYATNSDGTIVGFDSVGNRTLVASSALDNRLSQNLEGLAFDSLGNLYVANAGKNNIFKINTSGSGSALASVTNPKGVASDGTANLFVATSDGVIKEITFAGVISTFFADSNRSFAGVALDSAGNLFAADDANREVVEFTDPLNSFSTFASNAFAIAFKSGDLCATFPPTQEVFDLTAGQDLQINVVQPSGFANDSSGNLFVADQGGNAIFKFDTNGQSSIFADFDLAGPNFLAFGPALSTALVSITPQFSSATLENAAALEVNAAAAENAVVNKARRRKKPSSSISVVVNRSGQLNKSSKVLFGTVPDSNYSPQILHHAFFVDEFTPPVYYSTNDAQFQDAIRARAGRDYKPIAQTLVFGSGQTTKALKIGVTNNSVGGRRQFTVALKPQSAPLTVGPNVVETIVNKNVVAEIVGLTDLQSAVNPDATRDFSCTLTVLNTSSVLAGPIRVSLVGHAGATNGGSGPAPTPPADVNLGTFAVASSLPPNGSASTAVNATIPAPQGDAYDANTWYWVYAIVEEQQNGAWSAVAAPWLVLDGVRLVAGYVNPDGSVDQRILWNGGGVNAGTPGTRVGFKGNLGLLGGGPPTPIIRLAVSPPAQVTEGGSATFIIFATPNTARPLVIGYAMSGTATFGVDYTLSGNLGQTGQVTIPLGADFVSVTLTSNTDAIMEATETAVMTLVRQANGYTFPTAPKRKKSRKAPTPTVPAATVHIVNGP